MNSQTGQIDIVDIYGVWYEPWWKSTNFYLIISIAVITLTVFILYFAWKKYVISKEYSFEQIALLNLQELHQHTYRSDSDISDAYFRLTMIMKKYLSKRYGIGLLNKTDKEIISYIAPVIPPEISAMLQELFERAYQIKFAGASVSSKMLYDDIDFMQKVIYQTFNQEGVPGDS